MTFTTEQIAMMQAPLDKKHVIKGGGNGPKGDYIYGWHAINEANRIFGFDGWSYKTELQKVSEFVNGNSNHEIGYICKCTIEAGGVTRQDIGYGSGASKKLGDAHEGAVKEAVTDALKRCLRTFGNPFGLALYDKERTNVGTPTAQKIDPDNVEIIKLKASEALYDVGLILKRFKVQSLEELNTTQGETAIKSLNTKIDEKRIAAEQGKE
jgi:DNA recombination protein Rad52